MLQDVPPPEPPRATIVVTGRALPDPAAERAYSVERFDRDRIERSPSHDLDQLLKEVPGLQLFRRSDARSGHPTGQGVTLRALGGNASSRALLVLDGVPQSDPFGGWINWPAYDPATLEEIRIVRGGGSVTHGPGALAGTIDMISRADSGASGDASLGSRRSVEGRGRLGFGVGPGILSVSARAARSDGFIPITADTRGPADERAPYRQWSGRTRWVTPVGEEAELQASLAGFHDWRTRGTDFTENRTNGADASVRLVGGGRWQWSALGYWQWRNLRSSFANVSPGRTSATRVSLQDSVPSHGIGARLEVRPPMPAGVELRMGGDARRTDGESRELFAYLAGEPTRRRRAGGETWTGGGFVEASAALGRATLSGGVRIDHWRIGDGHLFEKLIAGGTVLRDDDYPNRSGWLPTARLGLVVPLSLTLNLRSAAYLGWRMPTLNELFRPFRAGLDATAANPHLDPERLRGAEIGADYANGPFRLSLTGFANRLRDSIANVTLGEGPGVFPGVGFVGTGGQYRQRQNLDSIRVTGVEASAEWTSGPWSLRTGLSLTRARVQADSAASPLDGLRPAQTPSATGMLGIGWERDGRAAQLILRHVGAQYEDDLNLRSLGGATTLDAFLSWPLAKGLQLVARGENLTDATVVAGILGDGAIERATPRTLWIGLRLGGTDR
ncbi:MAG TPA: TonB-dependent receptor [Sphingomicrobium sp.]|nr:TonB-dependent receptor [Sphingomicrobium sp.]